MLMDVLLPNFPNFLSLKAHFHFIRISHPNLLFSIRMKTFGNRIQTFLSEFDKFGGFDFNPNSDSEQKSPVQEKPITITHSIQERDPLPLFFRGTRREEIQVILLADLTMSDRPNVMEVWIVFGGNCYSEIVDRLRNPNEVEMGLQSSLSWIPIPHRLISKAHVSFKMIRFEIYKKLSI